MWQRIKTWFHDSETIFLARLEMLSGFVVAAVSAMDWSPLLSAGVDTGFTWRQGVSLGVIMCIKGLLAEVARRNRATDL